MSGSNASKSADPYKKNFSNNKPNGPGHGPHGGFGVNGMLSREKPANFKGTVKKLAHFIKPFTAFIVLGVIFAIGSTVFNVIGPKVMSQATTELFNGALAKYSGTGEIDFEKIGTILLITLALYGISALCSFVQSLCMAEFSQRLCFRLREAIARKIDRMPFGYFDSNQTGDTLSRITNDVDTLGQNLNQGLTQLVTAVITITGILGIMLTINVYMALIVLLIVPLSVLLIAIFVKFSQRYFFAQQSLLGVINSIVEETFSGHSVVKAFNHEEKTIEDFNASNADLYKVAWIAQYASSFMKPIMDFVSNLGYVGVAIAGSIFAAQGLISVGDIQAFIQYVKNFTQPISQLAQISSVFQQMAAAAERIFDFLDEPEIVPTKATACIDEDNCCVSFNHVVFGYSKDKPIIKDFNAEVAHGQTVALVGPTGAGKTTLVKLLMRFYDVDEGAICISGEDIRAMSPDYLRSHIGMVLQDTWLFNGTIRENIRYGNLEATDEEVEDAAVAGCADHFIRSLPGGYDFEINEDGDNISQGQRQLITIARAFLANRSMLILDEATSSVDTRTEKHIQGAMDSLMSGRTSFVIAHRLSTIKNADLILVIKDGDVCEQGTHEELLALDGFYAELYNSQFHDVG